MFVAPVQAIVTFLVKEGVVKKPEWEEGDWKNNLSTRMKLVKISHHINLKTSLDVHLYLNPLKKYSNFNFIILKIKINLTVIN